jgi:hypothetical protein
MPTHRLPFMTRVRELTADLTRTHEAWQEANDRSALERQVALMAGEHEVVATVHKGVKAFPPHVEGSQVRE